MNYEALTGHLVGPGAVRGDDVAHDIPDWLDKIFTDVGNLSKSRIDTDKTIA